MLIITNRKLNIDDTSIKIGDENLFGDELDNDLGEGEPPKLRFAKASKVDSDWRVELIEETNASENDQNIKYPSFERHYKNLREYLVEENKNCVFFVHGFIQSFKKNLNKCLDIEKKYGVKVIAFSWPSRPTDPARPNNETMRGIYKQARKNAENSAKNLNSIFWELYLYHQHFVNRNEEMLLDRKFSFLAFSLGNFLFQNSINQNDVNSHPILFDNVILCQPDVYRKNHKKWGDKINIGDRVYTTINQNDNVLKPAMFFENFFRLGQTAKFLCCKNMKYIDFTDGLNLNSEHEFFRYSTNKYVKSFFNNVLNGNEAEQEESFHRAFKFFNESNCYKFRRNFRKLPGSGR